MLRHTAQGTLTAMLLATAAAAAEPAHSLCGPDEKPLFSCPIAHSSRIVSLCLTLDGDRIAKARYLFGRPGAVPELQWVPDGTPAGAFHKSHLIYSGGTGGNAYSFSRMDNKYVLYSVQGTYQYYDAGILVQSLDGSASMTDLKCRAGKDREDANSIALFDLTRDWPRDDVLSQHGLRWPPSEP